MGAGDPSSNLGEPTLKSFSYKDVFMSLRTVSDAEQYARLFSMGETDLLILKEYRREDRSLLDFKEFVNKTDRFYLPDDFKLESELNDSLAELKECFKTDNYKAALEKTKFIKTKILEYKEILQAKKS